MYHVYIYIYIYEWRTILYIHRKGHEHNWVVPYRLWMFSLFDNMQEHLLLVKPVLVAVANGKAVVVVAVVVGGRGVVVIIVVVVVSSS